MEKNLPVKLTPTFGQGTKSSILVSRRGNMMRFCQSISPLSTFKLPPSAFKLPSSTQTSLS